MKKLFTLIGLFTLVSFAAMAQNEVLFKMKVMPSKHYVMAINMDINMLMAIPAKPAPKTAAKTATKKKVAPAAANAPKVMDMQMLFDMDLKTQARNAAEKIPFAMVVKMGKMKMTMDGKENPIPMPATTTTMFGTYDNNGLSGIDSVAGQKTTDAVKALSEKMMGLQHNVKFPDKPMKVGDSFTQDAEMNMPIAGISPGMKAKSVYTLTAIDGDKAYFDVKYNLDMGGTTQGMSFNMAGGGDGKMVYSMAANYATSMLMNMDMKYQMTLPQTTGKADCKMKMRMEYTTTITDN